MSADKGRTRRSKSIAVRALVVLASVAMGLTGAFFVYMSSLPESEATHLGLVPLSVLGGALVAIACLAVVLAAVWPPRRDRGAHAVELRRR